MDIDTSKRPGEVARQFDRARDENGHQKSSEAAAALAVARRRRAALARHRRDGRVVRGSRQGAANSSFTSPKRGSIRCTVQDHYSQTVCEAVFESLMTYDYLARPAKLVPRSGRGDADDQRPGQDVRLQDPQRHLFRSRSGIQGQAARTDRRRLHLHDQAFPRSRQQIARTKAFSAALSASTKLKKEAEKTGKFNYDKKVEGLQVARPVHAASQIQGNRLQLRAHHGAAEYRRSRARGDRGLSPTTPTRIPSAPVRTCLRNGSARIRSCSRPIREFRGFIWHFDPSDDPDDKELIAAMDGKKMPQIGPRRDQHHRGAAGGVARVPEQRARHPVSARAVRPGCDAQQPGQRRSAEARA